MKQKGDDYKLTAVKYYLNNEDTMDNTCKIFDCKKPSLHRWIQQYKTLKNLGRKSRRAVSYKIKKDQVKTALNILDKNEQYTMRSSVETIRLTGLESAGTAPISVKPCGGCLVSDHGSTHNVLSTTCAENNWDSDDDCDEGGEGVKWGPWIAVDGDVLRSPDKLRQFIEQSGQQRDVASK